MSVCDQCLMYPCSDNRKKIWGSCPAFILKTAKPITNYDRLIRKTPEEMARTIVEWLADAAEICGEDRKTFDLAAAEKYALDWLKSPVEEHT